jgi:hypothetical protein
LIETLALPPGRKLYTAIFREKGSFKPVWSPERNRRNAEKADKINTWVSKRGFKKFISPVEKLENRLSMRPRVFA